MTTKIDLSLLFQPPEPTVRSRANMRAKTAHWRSKSPVLTVWIWRKKASRVNAETKWLWNQC